MPLPGEKKPPQPTPLVPPSLPTPAPTPSPNVTISQAPEQLSAPKLKIRIRENCARSELIAVASGNDIPMSLKTVSGLGINLSVSVTTEAEQETSNKKGKLKPPKKRQLSEGSPQPHLVDADENIQDIFRESMKIREEIMASFESKRPKKKSKKEKRRLLESEDTSYVKVKKDKKHKKHKKEKRRKEHKVYTVNNDGSAPKLVIRLGKREDGSDGYEKQLKYVDSPGPSERTKSDSEPSTSDTFTRILPLKLKLARYNDGFVAKNENSDSSLCVSSVTTLQTIEKFHV